MGVHVDKEYRAKRSRAASGARRSAFAHKTRNGGKLYQRNVQERINRKGASKEVLVKFTGAARTRQGIRNAIDYMSRDSELPVMTEDGQVYTGDNISAVKEHMVDRVSDPRNVLDENGKENKKITQNLVFSPPVTAKVKPQELLESARKVLSEKFPDHRFVLGYHNDKKHHPHVHAILRLKNNDGKRVDIRKKDLRDMRTQFCENLKMKGYDVKATHKHKSGLNQSVKDANNTAPKRQKGLYEVADFGYDHFKHDKANKKQYFLKLRTLNKGVEKEYWAADFGELFLRENIQKGDVVRFKKLGQKTVNVPAIDKDGVQQGWKTTHRNEWLLENIGVKGVERSASPSKEIFLNDPTQLQKQQGMMRQFTLQKQSMLKQEQKVKVGLKLGL
ncbi:relaxase/mobilization nuclease domain-containing protein [Salmonella enterica]|nr:relaxase/mobilization nuclease domain-containing protein [Salmonella enterica]